MGRLLGKNIAIYTEVNGVRRVVGLSTSCTVDLNTDMVELASLAGTCRNYRPGKSGGTIGVERLLDVSGMSLMYMQVHRIGLKYVVEVDGMTLSGDAYISGQSAAAPVQGYATHRVTLTMTGEIGVDVGYMAFADAEVARLCEATFGDGIGLPLRMAEELPTIGTTFSSNKKIVTFDEFGLFGVTRLDAYTFYNCTALKSVTIPGSVTTIGGRVLQGCTSLTDVTLNEGLTAVGNYMFYNCTVLPKVILPESITSIGVDAFRGCTMLGYIALRSVTPPTLANTEAFGGVTSSFRIYVPEGSVDAYKSATNWNVYAGRIAASPQQ